MGEYERSEEYYSKGLGILETILTPNHPDLATIYTNLVKLYDSIGHCSKVSSISGSLKIVSYRLFGIKLYKFI